MTRKRDWREAAKRKREPVPQEDIAVYPCWV